MKPRWSARRTIHLARSQTVNVPSARSIPASVFEEVACEEEGA